MERRGQARAVPRPELDHERGRQDVDVQAAPRREVPQRPRVRGRRREVQLRARARSQAGLGRARLSLGHRADRRGGQAHGADHHQAAERVAPRAAWRADWSSIVPREVVEAATCAAPRWAPAPSSSRNGCPRATSRRGRIRTTGTRASRTSTPVEIKVIPGRGATSSPSSARATSTTPCSRTTRTTSW